MLEFMLALAAFALASQWLASAAAALGVPTVFLTFVTAAL
jgi:hypothetical protein